MNEQRKIRKQFLESFVKTLILNSKNKEEGILSLAEKEIIESIREKLIGIRKEPEKIQTHQLIKQIEETAEKDDIYNLQEIKKPLEFRIRELNEKPLLPAIPAKTLRKPLQIRQIPSRITHPLMTVPRPVQMQKIQSPLAMKNPQIIPSNTEKISIEALAKINSLITDPAVQTIECPGPEKPFLVFRSGVIQTTNLTLTKEEITNIMHEISEKTRIPLIAGVFKAAIDNIIITAVMSEFVGTRFIIQKKPRTPP